MIEISNLSKKYQQTTVLNIEQLNIPTGESFGLVGNNGAGKTTLFNLLLDLIEPTTGKVLNNDIQVNLSEAWKPFTSAFIDEHFLIDYLRPEEFFYFIGDLRGQTKAQVDEFLKGFENMFNDEILGKKKYIRDLSKGNQKKVGITAAMIGQPKLLILDEPFANLDPTTQIKLKKILREFSEKESVTLLVSSHDLNHVTEVCERIVVLEKGEIVKDTPTDTNTLKDLEAYFSTISEA